MPAIGKATRKAFTIAGLGTSGFPAFSGTNGQLDHGDVVNVGGKVTGDGSLRVAAAWIANTVIADEVSGLPLKLVLREDKLRTLQRPTQLRPLWDQPNDDQALMSWLATTSLSMTLHGVSYTMLDWRNNGELAALWSQPPTASRLERMDGGGLRLLVEGRGELENVPGKLPEFMMIPLYQLPGKVEPVSPVKLAAHLLGLSMQYDQVSASLAAKGFNPAAVMTFSESVEPDVAEKLSARLSALHSAGKSGGVAVVGGPDAKLEKFAMTLADAQFIAQNDRVFSLVMALWRVPPTVAGMVDKPSTWGTGVGEFARGLERFTIRPIVLRLQAGLEMFVTRWVEPDLQVRFKFDALLAANPKEKNEIQRLGLAAGMTSVQRVLAQNDEPPFDDDETVFHQLAQTTDGDRVLLRQRQVADTAAALVRAGVPWRVAFAVVGLEAPEETGGTTEEDQDDDL